MTLQHIGSIALVLVASAAATSDAAAKDWKGKRFEILALPHAQVAGWSGAISVGSAVQVGGASFGVATTSAGLDVETTPGGATTSVASGKTAALRASADARPIEVRFLRDAGGAWLAHAAAGIEFEVTGVAIRLVDLDLDGRVDGIGKDGIYLGDATVAFPYSTDFVVGTNRLKITSIEPDGSTLHGDLTKIEGEKRQLATIEAINDLRARNGLVPVDLDAALSARCTSHAEYLRVNHWDGLGNPHAQELGPLGASAEGALAAERSIIANQNPAGAVIFFWRTYYHRFRLMSPLLTKVGVNATPQDLAIIEDGEGADYERAWKDVRDATTVPADGATGVPTKSVSESPKEPCPDLGSRGFPIMFLFCGRGTKVTEFAATLTRGEGKKSGVEDVFIQQDTLGPELCGVIPKKPLAAKSAYTVRATYNLNGKPVERTSRFKTQ
jgi:hypothetical protein